MKPIDVFNSGKERSEHLLKLAQLLMNTRQRRIRRDWARDFKHFMNWRQRDSIDRVDGNGAMLILKESSGVTAEHFKEEYLNELLRAALAGIVAALDRYCHELILSRIVPQISKSPKKVKQSVKRLRVPVMDVRRALMHARKNPQSRPMNIVREALQEVLHEDTFQGPDDIARGLALIGVEDIWRRCATELNTRPKDITTRLNRIVRRRNRIVHEGDILRRKRGGSIAYHDISANQVGGDIRWISNLVQALESVVRD